VQANRVHRRTGRHRDACDVLLAEDVLFQPLDDDTHAPSIYDLVAMIDVPYLAMRFVERNQNHPGANLRDRKTKSWEPGTGTRFL